MFHNRIRRFEIARGCQSALPAAAFAALPAFALNGTTGGTMDLYRLAREQAEQQVAARREHVQGLTEWN